jgi:hypothetical protein
MFAVFTTTATFLGLITESPANTKHEDKSISREKIIDAIFICQLARGIIHKL